MAKLLSRMSPQIKVGSKPGRLGLLALVLAASVVFARAEDRWLHIKVDDTAGDNERVRVNVPLSLAEKVLPCIHADNLDHGRVKINGADVNGVDLRELLAAVRATQDSEFVTIQDRHDNVRVAKAGGNLLIKVREDHDKSTVDVKVPFTVVEALLSAGNDELDVGAAIRALSAHGDTELVTVNDKTQTVRIWVDSRSAAE
ncbi:MAG TPA: hypothetical protein VKU44_02140 [Terriglobia bacterium]|nr:hypothetical protein [Terriglobia bacterium]